MYSQIGAQIGDFVPPPIRGTPGTFFQLACTRWVLYPQICNTAPFAVIPQVLPVQPTVIVNNVLMVALFATVDGLALLTTAVV